jgi:hypothetical protein
VFDILKHPIQGFALDRGGDFKVIALTRPLTVAVDRRSVWILIGTAQKHFKKIWRCGVIMLSVTKKLPQILLQKPVEIAEPVQPLRMNDHAESRINQEGATCCSRFRIGTIHGDDGFKISERLPLQGIKGFGDEIRALIDWQSHSDAAG